MTVKKIVVSDTFKGFSEGYRDVLTYSCLVKLLANNELENQPLQLILGQGVRRGDLELLIKKYELSHQIEVISRADLLPMAGSDYSHKQKIQNIVVTLAQEVSENKYKLGVFFDGANEYFIDHVTGRHIQGMAVVEAIRQSFLTVTEQFVLNTSPNKYYFVINSMNTEFKRFLFPLDTHIEYEIIRSKRKPGRYGASIRAVVIQNSQECVIGHVDFTAFEDIFIGQKEQQLANDSLEYQFEDMNYHFEQVISERAA